MNEITRFAITDRAGWLKRREQDVTASVAAALFGDGVHPHVTPYKLWALKSGIIADDAETAGDAARSPVGADRAAIAARGEAGLGDRPAPLLLPRRRAADRRVARRARLPAGHGGTGVVQLKTVGHFAFKKGWRDADGEVEVPLWIAVQASVEAALTACKWAAVAAMALGDGGLEMHVVDVPLRPALMVRLRELTADFWRRVEANDPYPPDYGRDAATLARVYADDDGGEVDLAGSERATELVDQREALKATASRRQGGQKERKPLDAEIIHLLGNAARGTLGDGRVITAKTVKRGEYVVKATSYRAIKVTGGQA